MKIQVQGSWLVRKIVSPTKNSSIIQHEDHSAVVKRFWRHCVLEGTNEKDFICYYQTHGDCSAEKFHEMVKFHYMPEIVVRSVLQSTWGN